jgi:L-serine dehydratase
MATVSVLNDVLGPVMRGPSSSHTAGAYRIARLSAMLAGAPPARIRVSFDPAGSYAPTREAMGLDLAMAAALLGWDMTDARYTRAAAEAAAAGMELTFADIPLPGHEHPNDMRVELVSKSGSAVTIWARSIGGGMVDVYGIGDDPCRIDGKAWSVWVRADRRHAGEVRRAIAERLGGTAPVLESEREGAAVLQWDSLQPVNGEPLRAIRALKGILDVRSVGPILHVPRGAAAFASASEMLSFAGSRAWSLGRAVRFYESQLLALPEAELDAEMLRRYEIMRSAVALGLDDTRATMPLCAPSAGPLLRAEREGRLPIGGMYARAAARGLAALHACNAKAVVCAAPTGGSSGVIPGVLVTLAEERGVDPAQIAAALWAAGGVGLILAVRGTFAAEEAGCQVEIGAASAMAAASVVEIAGGTATQSADAASIAFQNTIGLVCDPVGGGCEIPCHTRTAAGVAGAFVCADLIRGGYRNPIALDDAIDASIAAGRQLPPGLRCTARGGVAATPSARAFLTRRS